MFYTVPQAFVVVGPRHTRYGVIDASDGLWMALGPRGRPQRIRDPLHDLIEFDASRFEQMLWRAIQSPPFQRLRRVRQLGFSEYVYPGATHTRFAHSLGVFYNARRLMRNVERHIGSNDFNQYRSEAALTAALLHDVGHGPFSHSFEAIGKSLDLKYAKHENVSDEIIKNTEIAEILDDYNPGMANQVANIIGAKTPADVYSSVVSSQFDADRLDYMQRDRMMTGTQHSEIDLTWLIANLELDAVPFGVGEEKVGEVETFVLSAKAIYAAETYVVGLFQLYPTVYFHKATKSAEKVFFHLFERVFRLSKEGKIDLVGLSPSNPIVAFAGNPDSLQNALQLDDSVIWGSLAELCASRDASISQLAAMLRERKLPKAIDLRAAVAQELGDGTPPEIFEKAVLLSRSALGKWCDEQEAEIPAIWIDTAQRVPYKEFQEDTGPVNQILIRQNGVLVDLKEVSPIVDSIRPFRLDRVYIPFPDDRLNARVVETVKQKSKEAKGE